MTVQSQRIQPQHQGSQPPSLQSSSGKRPSRLPFWLGFLTSFVVLSVVSVSFLLMSTGLDRFDLANLQSGESGWSPPEVVPTPTADESVVSASVSVGENSTDQYPIGTVLRNLAKNGLNIRHTPGHLGKLESEDVIGQIASGDTVEIIGGPATADELTWWQIRYRASDGTVTEGWSTEATTIQILGPVQ